MRGSSRPAWRSGLAKALSAFEADLDGLALVDAGVTTVSWRE
jgi:hypothetical protein